ncbi:MAG: hypothetical protein A3F70_11255 [Acidobacteria bacterium RIFCSPLOWO2_12_FULL_67_14]|nr:MAG: hypothetical protein A3F70_11255 [Acidobacteria bacterium RIFCSPLOWO2_12_FULL_67_14]
MIEANLDTTNLLLGIMAAVSVLQALLLVAGGVVCYRMYRRSMAVIRGLEERQIAPLAAKVNALIVRVDDILGDVRNVTALVTHRTERVDAAIDQTIHRVDETAGRVRASVASRVSQLAALVRGLRGVIGGAGNGRRTTPTAV